MQIRDELEDILSALSLTATFYRRLGIFDLCMAPGGFTASVLERSPHTRTCRISLPPSQDHHEGLHLTGPKQASDVRN